MARTSTSASTGPSDENEPAVPGTAPSAESETSKPTADVEPGRRERTPEGPRDRRRFRRRWLLLLLGLLAIVAILVVEVPQWLSSTPSDTIWNNITADINDGIVPKQTALEAFAYVFKVDVPGVTIPAGQDAADKPTSGTAVMEWVLANWGSLTPDQQAVINRYRSAPPSASPSGSTAGSAAGGAAGQAAAFRRGSNAGQLADALPASRGPAPAMAAPSTLPFLWPYVTRESDVPTADAQAVVDDIWGDIVHLGPRLGLSTITPGSALFPNIMVHFSDTSGGNDYFLTQVVVDHGQFAPCDISVWKNTWSNASLVSGGTITPTMHDLLEHEVIHCYQNSVWGDLSTALSIPPWMKEGTAMFLAADDTGVGEPMIPSMWEKGYLDHPEKALTNRTYDSYGYFALLQHEGRDMWSLIPQGWKAAAASKQRSNAFIAVLKGDDPDIRNNWAESLVDNQGWGDPWQLYGFGAPSPANVWQHPVTAIPDPGTTGSLDSRSNTLLNVGSAQGDVVTIATDGLASVHDDSGHSVVAFTSQSFCVKEGGCVCPQGTLLAGQNVAPNQLSMPFVAALNAPEGGSQWAVISAKLDDLCKHQATPTPQSTANYGPCGANCSQSNGDPHMLTVNQYRYDMQAAGEFTLVTSPDGSVDIQARQEPYGTSGQVAINTAVATKVGGHRVGVYATGSGLVAHVDGAVVDLTAGPQDLGNGGRIAAVDKGFEIDFPDGTQMWALAVGQWGINAQIKASATLRADATGVLGPVVAGGLGIPALPDGTRLPVASSETDRRQTINGRFADAWRLSDATSLFDYDPGKSTATYTIKPYPTDPKYGSVADLSSDQVTAGNAACSTVTDQGLHDQCVFDVGVTGQAGFAQSYTRIQGFYDVGVAVASPTPEVIPSSSPAPGLVSGAFTVTQGTRIGGYALGPDNTVYLTVQAADGTNTLISFDPVAGKIIHQVTIPAATPVHVVAGSVWLPGLKTDSNGHNCSITRFDAGTLAEQATIPVPCNAFGSAGPTASDGTALWFEDDSKYDLTTLKGAVVTRIDPTTNAPGASVPLPSVGGRLLDSQGALFYVDEQESYFRLTTGSAAFDSFGSMSSYFSVYPAGTGLWAGTSAATSALYFTQAGTPSATIQVGGGIVTGDTHAAYAEVLGNSDQGVAEEQLWEYPLDGSTPTMIATSPTIDGNFLDYFGDPLPIDNGNGVLKLWSTRGANQQLSDILLQWAPVP